MNIKPVIYAAFILILVFIGSSNLMAQSTVAVMDFIPKGVSDTEVSILTDRLRTELSETGKYTIVEREMMNLILAEQGFQMTGCTDQKCIVAAGQILNAAQVVAGSIGKVGMMYTISARIVDVETGKVSKTATFDHEGNIEGLLKTGMKHVAGLLSGDIIDDSPEYREKEKSKSQTGTEKKQSDLQDKSSSRLNRTLGSAIGLAYSSIPVEGPGTIQWAALVYTKGISPNVFLELKAGFGWGGFSKVEFNSSTEIDSKSYVVIARIHHCIFRDYLVGISLFSGFGIIGWQKHMRYFIQLESSGSRSDRTNWKTFFPLVPMGANISLYQGSHFVFSGSIGYMYSLKELTPDPYLGFTFPSISPAGGYLSLRITRQL